MSNSLVFTQRDVTPALKETVRGAVFPNSTDEQLALYFHECERNGVHPLDRLIFPQVRKGRYVSVTSIDLMRSRAASTGSHAGTSDVEFGPMAKAAWGEHPEWARVKVYRIVQGVSYEFPATARWSEYYPGECEAGFMWRTKPHLMLGKCAEGLALRKGFPREVAGLYVREEMDQAGPSEVPNGYSIADALDDDEALASPDGVEMQDPLANPLPMTVDDLIGKAEAAQEAWKGKRVFLREHKGKLWFVERDVLTEFGSKDDEGKPLPRPLFEHHNPKLNLTPEEIGKLVVLTSKAMSMAGR